MTMSLIFGDQALGLIVRIMETKTLDSLVSVDDDGSRVDSLPCFSR